MRKNLLFTFVLILTALGFANAQALNITYTTPQTAYIGKPLAPVTPANTGGAVPNRLYPQNVFLNTASNYLSSVRDLVRTSNGDVFVCGETQIFRFRTDGSYGVFAGSGTWATTDGVGTSASFQEMNGIDKDAAGNLYVTESNSLDGANSKIRKITPAGVVTTPVSGLNGPFGIAVAGNGIIYITTYSGKIMKVAADGTTTFLAGQGTGKADGVGAAASFYTPNALVADAAGNLFVNDYNSAYNENLISKDDHDRLLTVFSDIAYVEITTRSGNGPFMKATPGTYLYKPLAFSLPRQFYKPRYIIKSSITNPDLRSTIHWEPNLVTGTDGRAVVSFYAQGTPGNYTAILQGADMNGSMGHSATKIKINK